jgi:O-antigen ligase
MGRAHGIGANPDADIILKLAFMVVALEIFMATSRGLEIIASFGITVPYLGVTIYAVALLVSLVTGRWPAMATSRAGVFMMLFTLWMLICTPMSQWRGGTVYMLEHDWSLSVMAFLSCGAIVTLRQCRQIATVLAAGVLFVSGSSVFLSTLKEGRMAMQEGTLGNANDLSMLMLISVPFVMVPLFRRDSSSTAKVFASVVGAFALWVTIRAGSRSGLLALVAMLLVLFVILPFAAKLRMGLATIVLTGLLLLSAPSYILFRYATTFSDPTSVEDLKNEAFGSKIVRQQLFWESVGMTLENPVFGVGPGVFIAAEASAAQLEGRPAKWRLSHNSFTQVSSETGFPGFILWFGSLWAAFANVFWMRKNAAKDPSGLTLALSMALLISLVGLTTNYLFSSSAYVVYMPLLIGLSVAFRGAAEREFALVASAPIQPASDPVTARGLDTKPTPPIAPVLSPPAAGHRYRLLGRPRRLSH